MNDEQDVALSPRASSLLAAGRREHIDEEAKAKLATAVVASMSATAGATVVATTTRTLIQTKLFWIVGGGSGLALALALALAAHGSRSAGSTIEQAPAVSAPAAFASGPRVVAPSETVATPEPASANVAVPVVPPSVSTSKHALAPIPAGTPSAHASADTWESEAEALATARGALRAGKADEALSRLDKYFVTFPHGHLELEARVLRIRAYAKSDPTRARREAEALRKAHPSSAYDDELKTYAP